MRLEPRGGKPYIWVTWLTGLIAGEKSCQWAAWIKAHYRYDELPEADEDSLLLWKAEHANMVRTQEAFMRADGYRPVTIEEQNKFTYRGKLALVGGKPDAIGYRDDVRLDGPGNPEAVIADCKSGRERDSDAIQVAIYMTLAPQEVPHLRGRALRGEVVYQHRVRPVGAETAANLKDVIVAQVLRTAGDEEPPRTPSAGECRFCNIAECPDRVAAATAPDENAVVVDEAIF